MGLSECSLALLLCVLAALSTLLPNISFSTMSSYTAVDDSIAFGVPRRAFSLVMLGVGTLPARRMLQLPSGVWFARKLATFETPFAHIAHCNSSS